MPEQSIINTKQMDLDLVDQIRSTFNRLPDYRKQGNNQKYAMKDAALSAFSVFFTQSSSFLDYQLRMQKHHNRNNAQSVFGVHQIPLISQIGNKRNHFNGFALVNDKVLPNCQAFSKGS